MGQLSLKTPTMRLQVRPVRGLIYVAFIWSFKNINMSLIVKGYEDPSNRHLPRQWFCMFDEILESVAGSVLYETY